MEGRPQTTMDETSVETWGRKTSTRIDFLDFKDERTIFLKVAKKLGFRDEFTIFYWKIAKTGLYSAYLLKNIVK